MGAPAYSTIIDWEPLRDISYASMAITYIGVGSPMANPIRLMKVYNQTDVTLFLSNDGINDKDFIPANSQFIYDIGSNTSTQGGWLVLNAGSRIYVRYPGSAPTVGGLLISVIYGTDTSMS
jgi:hypothetical protein